MALLRLLFLLAVGWFLWRIVLRAVISSPSAAAPRSGEQDYLPLTQCTICGAHIPRPPDGRAPICDRCRNTR